MKSWCLSSRILLLKAMRQPSFRASLWKYKHSNCRYWKYGSKLSTKWSTSCKQYISAWVALKYLCIRSNLLVQEEEEDFRLFSSIFNTDRGIWVTCRCAYASASTFQLHNRTISAQLNVLERRNDWHYRNNLFFITVRYCR